MSLVIKQYILLAGKKKSRMSEHPSPPVSIELDGYSSGPFPNVSDEEWITMTATTPITQPAFVLPQPPPQEDLLTKRHREITQESLEVIELQTKISFMRDDYYRVFHQLEEAKAQNRKLHKMLTSAVYKKRELDRSQEKALISLAIMQDHLNAAVKDLNVRHTPQKKN